MNSLESQLHSPVIKLNPTLATSALQQATFHSGEVPEREHPRNCKKQTIFLTSFCPYLQDLYPDDLG